jgi:hypothetical protein
MAAAPSTGVTASKLCDAVSPELVLVDSELATRVRALLPDPDGGHERPASVPFSPGDALTLPAQAKSRKPQVFPMPFPDNGSVLEAAAASGALQRLMENAVDSELDSRVSSQLHFRRLTTLIPASSAATATSILVLQLCLSAGSFG